jgi:hypothetical protein
VSSRREFITLLGSATAWPLVARAQQLAEAPRVGFVYPGPKAVMAARMEAIVTGLRASGYAAKLRLWPEPRKTTRIRSLLW